MKTIVQQENLKAGLQAVGRAASPRATLPVLANVLLEANGSHQLKLSATNLQMGITCWLPAEIQEAGATTVPATTINDLIGNLPRGQIALSLDSQTETLGIQADQSNTQVKGIVATEFPPALAAQEAQTVVLAADLLKTLIHRTAFSVSTDEARPVLTGVLFRFEGDRLTLASADGFRLSTVEELLPDAIPTPFQAIVPAQALREFATVAPESGAVEMVLQPNRIAFRMENLEGPIRALEVVSLLIEGNFPSFEAIIPTGCATRVEVDRLALLRACKQAQIFARESSNIGSFQITPGVEAKPGTVVVQGRSDETGSNQSLVDAQVTGPGLEIAFNIRYVQDALQILNTSTVAFEFNAAENPGVLRAVGDDNYCHVIMPMHI